MIVVLTYNNPHRKTQDLIFKLLAKGIKPIVVATEWVEMKSFKPIISHRPANPMSLSLSRFCENLGLKLVLTTKSELHSTLKDIDKIDSILLATGNIIEEGIVTDFNVINSHPGYLPVIKGLDALKWAILYEQKIGVTTHFVNSQVDGGTIIQRQFTPVFYEDSFHNLAYRQYEMEVDLLVNSIFCEPEKIEIGDSPFETFRRMPHRLEYRMLDKFEELKNKSDFRTKHLKNK